MAARAWHDAQRRDPPPALSALLPALPSRLERAAPAEAGEPARYRLVPPQAARLRNAARNLTVTRPQLLFAAWAALLHRLAYQEDLLLGLAVSRHQPTGFQPAEPDVVLPVRLRIDAGQGFGDWTRRTARQMRAALRHRRVLLARPPDAQTPPPASVVFNYLTRARMLRDLRPADRDSPWPANDIVLSVEEAADDSLLLRLDAQGHPPEEVARLLGRLVLLLDGIATAGAALDGLRIADLEVMDAAERQTVTGAFSHGPSAPPMRTLVELLAAMRGQDAQAPALAVVSTDGTTELGYGALEVRSNRLARHLLASELRPGDTVAVLLPRNETLIVTLLACAKAGIAYCPLDPTQPGARLEQLVKACRARRLLTDADGAARVSTRDGAMLLDEVATLACIEARPATVLSDAERGGAVGPDSIAYVIFTSGSTGFPKGVMVSHGAIGTVVQAYAAGMHIEPGMAVISTLSIAFDPATLDMFAALAHGARLVLLDDATRRDPAHVAAAIEMFRPALLAAAVSVWRSLPIETLPADLAAVSGGEAFPTDLVPRMRRLRVAMNAYGPTEASVLCCMRRLEEHDQDVRLIPVGRPIAGTRVWIVDRGLQPVPIGASGELCIGGPALASGYVGQPAQTAAAFVPSPFGPGRLYRTGDLARWRPDGVIELLGRIDQQVKLRGHRIEPGEIEHVLRSLPGMADAAVVVRGDGADARLVAYLVAEPDAELPQPRDLQAALAERLPGWMVPAAFVSMPVLPRTIAGKLDRAGLPDPAPLVVSRNAATPGRPPGTPDEALLCRLFARLTGYAGVAVDSDFFDIGGNSLRAMILVTELRQHGRHLPLAGLYAGRTPAAIAATWTRSGPSSTEALRPTLFVIPGCGGDDPGSASFRVSCADAVDSVLLEYPDWPRFASSDFDMNQLVAELAGRVRSLRPQGPLLLAGYSQGGFIAWAMARLLEEQGCAPDLLLLIDAVLIDLDQRTLARSRMRRALDRFNVFAESYRAHKWSGLAGALGDAVAYRVVRWPHLLRLLVRLRPLRLPASFRYRLRFSVACELQRRAVAQSGLTAEVDQMGAYGGNAVLFRASMARAETIDPDWMTRCSKLEIQEAEGDHRSILTSRGGQSLAVQMQRAISAVSRH